MLLDRICCQCILNILPFLFHLQIYSVDDSYGMWLANVGHMLCGFRMTNQTYHNIINNNNNNTIRSLLKWITWGNLWKWMEERDFYEVITMAQTFSWQHDDNNHVQMQRVIFLYLLSEWKQKNELKRNFAAPAQGQHRFHDALQFMRKECARR